jgi:transposase InsO family protein
VAVDSLTKFVEIKPVVGSKKKGVDAEEVANFAQSEIFHRYGGVFEVVTDRGPEFSSLFSALCKSWGATHVQIAARNPQANGQVERYMQVIKATLRKCANENPREWHIYVSGICSEIRSNVQESVKMSPHQCNG